MDTAYIAPYNWSSYFVMHTYYGEVPECNGVYANAATLEACREELLAVLEEWVLFRVHQNLSLPAINGMELKIRKVA